MKVWVVEHGCYSDRHVVTVTDSEALADQIAALDSGRATEYDLNEVANRLVQGVRRWRVSFFLDTGDCAAAELDYDAFDLSLRSPVVNSYPNPPSKWRKILECPVDARDKDEAIKIAADVRRAYLAMEPSA